MRFLRRHRFLLAGLVALPLSAVQLWPGSHRAAVWDADLPGGDAAFAREIATHVEAAGYQVQLMDSLDLIDTARVHTNAFDLLVLPNARVLPFGSAATIKRYLEQGGDLLALGLPGWQEPRFRLGGRWMSRDDYERTLSDACPQAMLFDLSRTDPQAWKRRTNDPQSPAQREILSEDGNPVLHVVIQHLTSWDVVEPPALLATLGAGQTLTCFRARGAPPTTQLAVEWMEQDGSRWIATVDLTPEWRRYALTPDSFKSWDPPPSRGGPGDTLDVRKAAGLTFGLALSHNSLPQGRHEYWIADVGAAPNPLGDEAPPATTPLPRLESFCPAYMGHRISTAVAVRLAGFDATLERYLGVLNDAHPAQDGWMGLHPRPQGTGFNQARPFRWEPLLSTWDPQTASPRGDAAAMVVHADGPFRGGVWCLFSPAHPEFYRHFIPLRSLRTALERMRRGLFLLEGGAEFFTVFPGSELMLGARVANFDSSTAPVTELRLNLTSANGRTNLLDQSWPMKLEPGNAETRQMAWTAGKGAPGSWKVRTILTADGQRVDELTHHLSAWRPTTTPDFVTIHEGGFQLAGRPWKAHGVNYMPSSGIGIASEAFEHWLDRGAYDPDVIQRDLERVHGMGLNAVSVFVYHRSLRHGHLIDFLRRCEQLSLKVDLSLRPGTPMEFRWTEMKEIIEQSRLASNATVFAYDLAWEPSHYDENYQRIHYSRSWNDWVLQRYGSVAAARQHWGSEDPANAEARIPPPPNTESSARSLDSIPVPRSTELTQDGPWRRRIADYRLFLDELVGAAYAEARRLVKSIDPNHPVSFRMQFAGDPTFNHPGLLPFDFHGLRDAVDVWEPEAYGRIGDWAQVRPGCFTAAYARLCDPAKPVLWSEMGYDCWDAKCMAPGPRKLDFAAEYYTHFYRMLIDSGADGVFFWWYPGGYRLNERSDFGILEPDGTDRPATRVIRAWNVRFLAAPKPAPPTAWIEVDRDRDARGLPGMYDAVQSDYWRATEAGSPPGLKWIRRPGEP